MEHIDPTAVFQQPGAPKPNTNRPTPTQCESPNDERRTCEFPGCAKPIPRIPGREPRYCGPEHRESARTYRRRARHGGVA